jgi:uncharacterized OB-fold protein
MKTENMGWQCPNCLVVYAPSVQRCECSTLPKVSFSGFGTTTTGTVTMRNGYISDLPKLYALNVEIINGNIQLISN